jgi:ubiquinone/menaquinone biosynthesis C-methylase UbiE
MSPNPFNETYGASAPENYERFFVPVVGEPLARDLVKDAALKPGERVLDVACGTGIVARLAAEAVGPEGAVTGVDVNPGMLAVARAVSGDAIAWREGDMASLPFSDGEFDAVICQLSLQFVPDKARALAEMKRVARPGGRVVLNVPGPAPKAFAIIDDALAQHVGPAAAGFVRQVFSVHDTEEIDAMLQAAGFKDTRVQAYQKDLQLPPARDFLWQYISSTPLAGIVTGADESARNALEQAVVTGWKRFESSDGVDIKQRVVVAHARA